MNYLLKNGFLLLVFMVTINGYAEDLNLDSLLLEMDNVADSADSLLNDDRGLSNAPSVEKPKKQKQSNTDEKKGKSIESVVKNSNIKSSTEDLKKKKENSSDVVVVDDKTENKAEPKKSGDDFGDFKVAFEKNSKVEIKGAGFGRDPFSPSGSMVAAYKGELKKAQEEREKTQKERRLAAKKISDEKDRIKRAKALANTLKEKQEVAVQHARQLALPKMKLKGLIRKPQGEVLALLDIAGIGIHIVRKGDTVSLGSSGTIKIITIKDLSVEILAEKMSDNLIIR